MATRDYYPGVDARVLIWLENFNTKLPKIAEVEAAKNPSSLSSRAKCRRTCLVSTVCQL